MMTNSEFPQPALGNLGGRSGIQNSKLKIQNSSTGERGATL